MKKSLDASAQLAVDNKPLATLVPSAAGKRLKELIEKKGLTYAQIMARMPKRTGDRQKCPDKYKGSLSRYFSGDPRMPLEVFNDIASAIGVNPMKILDEALTKEFVADTGRAPSQFEETVLGQLSKALVAYSNFRRGRRE